MDGFALRAADTPGTLPVVERIAAGRPAEHRFAAGEAMGIATGGVVPEGADAVVPIEYVVERGNVIEISEPVAPGANVRPRGGDVRAGDGVVAAGARLGPAQLGALAAAGVAEVACARAAAGRRSRHGNRASPPRRAARAGRDLRGERADPRGAARARRALASSACRRSPTTRPPIARRSSAGSSTTCS